MSRKRRALARADAHQHLGPRSLFLLTPAEMILLLLVLCSAALAQPAPVPQTLPSQNVSEDQAYRDAIAAAGPGGDVLKLENYASTATGQHRKEALAWLVWTYKQIGDSAMATKWANELRSIEPGNALALAVLANADQQITRTSPSEPGADQPLSLAKQALRNLDQFSKPEGMTHEAFTGMKTDLSRGLNGAVGYAYFQRHDYLTARGFLRQAVALAPDNAQYTYALALADLEGRNANTAEGFKMLARSVNLTLGTPAGVELATYARAKYRFAGGSDADWDRFIAATRVTPPPPKTPDTSAPEVIAKAMGAGGTTGTAVGTQPTSTTSGAADKAVASSQRGASAPATSAAISPSPRETPVTPAPVHSSSADREKSQPVQPQPTTSPTETASAAVIPAAPARSQPATPATPTPQPPPTIGAAQAPAASSPAPATASGSTPSKTPTTRDVPALPAEVATVTPLPKLPPRPPLHVFAADSPVSLGILIETATTSRDTRASVINTLTDMVRRLREHDEAFLVSFSNEVVFERDLTNNSKALEEAMDRIKPLQGTALFDAVAFAAGHLKRIAANQNRVLLVISDGSNNTNTISPLELSGEITMSGVKIYCIGLQASTPEDQQRLTALANATGGRAIFLGGAGEFRGAAREVAARMGIPF